MVVEVKKSSSSFEIGLPRPLFELPVQLDSRPLNAYQVMANGQRFLVKTAVEEMVVPITVVVNWTASLTR